MSTFARIESNFVAELCVADAAEWCEQELGGAWVKATDDARIGSRYWNEQFFPPSPYPSWRFSSALPGWEAPVPLPDRPEVCHWSEADQTWIVAPESHRMYALWLHEPIQIYGALYRACSADEEFMPVPTFDDGQKLVKVFPQVSNQNYQGVLRHRKLVCIAGKLLLTYTYVDDEIKKLSDELIASHPFLSTYTYDELVQNLIEWEWTGVALGNTEWQTDIATICLDALGVTEKQRSEVLAARKGPIAQYLVAASESEQ